MKKRKYFRKCGICGELFEQSDMLRDSGSETGWLCIEAALDRFTYENGDIIPETLENGEENTVSVKIIKAVLRSITAADVVEVRHGRWEMRPYNGVYDMCCSVCGFCPGIKFYSSNFCPNCGAKMDGGEKINDRQGKVK